MPTVAEMVQQLALKIVTRKAGTGASVTGGYASDLLSCVMARAQAGNVWVTLQAHPNVVAVASLLNLACVIVTEGTPIEPPTIEKAEEMGIPIASTPLTTYAVVERLHDIGVRAAATVVV
jgi:hypothetical protein